MNRKETEREQRKAVYGLDNIHSKTAAKKIRTPLCEVREYVCGDSPLAEQRGFEPPERY